MDGSCTIKKLVGGQPLFTSLSLAMSQHAALLAVTLAGYRAAAMVSEGVNGAPGNVTDNDYRRCVDELLAAAGVTNTVGRVERLENVQCIPALPGKCYSVAREAACGDPECVSYVEGVLFPEGCLFPVGHALVRTNRGHTRLLDLTRTLSAGDEYYAIEIEASTFRDALADPAFAAEFERHVEFPYLRAYNARVEGRLPATARGAS